MKMECAKFVVAALALSLCLQAQAAWETPGISTPQMAIAQASQPIGLTATISSPASSYFNISADDVSKAVALQLQLQAVETKAEVSLAAGSPNVIYSADHPLKVVIHSLQVDTQSRRWQAQANILANGKTETVKPVSGIYVALVDVPVLTRQLSRTDIIEAQDITTKSVQDRFIRKDTVTDAKTLIGQSPRATISTNRPIRMTEISSPVLVKKGSPVQLTFTDKYMSIKTTGVALQDGALGEMIRIKNDKSEKAVSGRVASSGRVEVNTTPAL
ncbi:MAG: flagellar basal body P-ring formation chaperone FlgA [Rickettsiales bacterium]